MKLNNALGQLTQGGAPSSLFNNNAKKTSATPGGLPAGQLKPTFGNIGMQLLQGAPGLLYHFSNLLGKKGGSDNKDKKKKKN